MVSGTLYIVATPIGNLDDISRRAQQTLRDVAVIAAEDTRHSGRLLQACGIVTPMVSLHEHNEQSRADTLVRRLRDGDSVALISDAGTPLVSDPGYRLVYAAAAAGIRISPIPGPSSVIAALSVAGLPSDRFVFEGFLPAKPGARRKRLEQLTNESRSLVLLESSHRIAAALRDMCAVFGPRRQAVVARELTKLHETVLRGELEVLVTQVEGDADQQRGEFTLVIAGAPESENDGTVGAMDLRTLLAALLEELPPTKAASVAAKLVKRPRREVYALAVELGGAYDR
ncbi:16S rRNA (cytidine(1402)-2'-O)-methyltransferase [Natronocella acetinitrilica]|uniref:16S rRNA (cytidine(1402)-2'-O)-methyltransferase n=1 Tax=Natronocella acetinitrilica TaxID=414046 RepID=UPI00209F2BF7|nr:16S rRNA (cytidine(1402)-2'-O)-methyltransferase [Natronocella acetinitrilica]